jgi:hypothetical protein
MVPEMNPDSVVYYLDLPRASDPIEDAEWLLSDLKDFTVAEIKELLYVAREPDFFELMRAIFALPEEARSSLQKFLTTEDPGPAEAMIDPTGRCILHRGAAPRGKDPLKIVD